MAAGQDKTRGEASRRTTLRVAGGSMAAMAALLGTGTLAGAGAAQPGQGIEGAWRVVATTMAAPPSPQLNFFGPGGLLVSVPPTTQARTIGLGHWVQTREREYNTTFWFHRFDAMGALVGSSKLLGRPQLHESGDTYSGVFRATLYDLNDVMVGSGGGTLEGTRLKAEPFEF